MKNRTYNFNNAERVELYYSKLMGLLSLLLAVVIVSTTGMAAFALALQKGVAIFGWFGLGLISLIVVPLGRFTIRSLLSNQPVVVFDDEGVTDVRQRDLVISWSEIGNISLGWGNGAYHYLRFEFRSTEAANRYPSHSSLAWFFFTRVQQLGDFNIFLLTLRCSRREALQIAQRFQKRSATEMINRINANGGRDYMVVDSAK